MTKQEIDAKLAHLWATQNALLTELEFGLMVNGYLIALLDTQAISEDLFKEKLISINKFI